MTDSNSTPTHEQITRRAYEIFVERGHQEGRDLDHWLEAERQLRAAGKAKSASPVAATATTTNAPIRGTQPAAPANGRPSNGRSTRPAARK